MELLQPYLPIIYIAAGVIALILLLLWGIRIFSGKVRGRKGSRLGISEYYEIDKSRRLVLIRRDDMEHLLLIGGEHDLVIESEIGSPLLTAPAQPRPAPRPAVFGNRRPMLRPVDSNGEIRPARDDLEN